MWKVLSLQTGKVRDMSDFVPEGIRAQAFRSATIKEPQIGPVRLTRLGFMGDEQADLENHGGEEKAVLFYAGRHYAHWRAELPGRAFGPGGFGENLTVDFTEEDIAVGDVLRVGSSLVEISQPRVPCWKQAWRWDVKDLAERMQETGRTGFYGRVLEPGDVRSGDAVTLQERRHPGMTVARFNQSRYGLVLPDERQLLGACPALAADWRRWLERHRDD